MSPLALFLAGALPAFASGLLARPYVDRLIEGTHMQESIRHRAKAFGDWLSSPRGLIAALVLSIVVACGALIYTVQANGDNQDRDQAQAAKATADNKAVIDCINRYIERLSTSSKKRTDANTAKDEALAKVIDAAGDLLIGQPTPEQTAKARAALIEYSRLASELAAVRVTTPVPTFSVAFCESQR